MFDLLLKPTETTMTKPKPPNLEAKVQEDLIQPVADKINSEWKKGNYKAMVECYVNTGNMLRAAKGDIDLKGIDKLPHGAFEDMVRSRLDFLPRTARKLMSIAAHPIISNRSNWTALPGSWTTLYKLTTVDRAILEENIASGKINPHMQAKQIPGEAPKKKRKGERDELEAMQHALDTFLKKVQKRAAEGGLNEAEYGDTYSGMDDLMLKLKEGAVVLKEQMGKPPAPKVKLPPDEEELVGLTLHMAGDCVKFEKALNRVDIARISSVALNYMM